MGTPDPSPNSVQLETQPMRREQVTLFMITLSGVLFSQYLPLSSVNIFESMPTQPLLKQDNTTVQYYKLAAYDNP